MRQVYSAIWFPRWGWILIFLVVRLGARRTISSLSCSPRTALFSFPLRSHMRVSALVLHADPSSVQGPRPSCQAGDHLVGVTAITVMAFSSRRSTNGSGGGKPCPTSAWLASGTPTCTRRRI